MYVIYAEKNSEVQIIGTNFEYEVDARLFAEAVEQNDKKIPIKCWVVEK